MTRSANALINPELLVWARECLGMDQKEGATRLAVPVEKLSSWESGESYPTVKQLQHAASVYRQSFASFYLPTRPPLFRPPLRDYRLLPGRSAEKMSPELAFDIRQSLDRREICIELLSDLKEKPRVFSGQADLQQDPEDVAAETREKLGVTLEKQNQWRDSRLAFNFWRQSIERHGILVFQSTTVRLEEMRGYSIAQYPVPIIVVNRKDAYNGRIFSLLHEYAHLLLRTSGICDLDARSQRLPADQRVEVFCNFVAGAAAVPKAELLAHRIVTRHLGMSWTDSELLELSRFFSVSREVIARRLLLLGMTTEEFYAEKRQMFQKEYEDREKSEGFIAPATNVVSAAGKPFVRLVLNSFNSDVITSSDVSDYLGVRLSHLDKIAEAVMTE